MQIHITSHRLSSKYWCINLLLVNIFIPTHTIVQMIVHQIVLNPHLSKSKSIQAPTLIWIQTNVDIFGIRIGMDNILAALSRLKGIHRYLDLAAPSSSQRIHTFNSIRSD